MWISLSRGSASFGSPYFAFHRSRGRDISGTRPMDSYLRNSGCDQRDVPGLLPHTRSMDDDHFSDACWDVGNDRSGRMVNRRTAIREKTPAKLEDRRRLAPPLNI